MVLLPDPKQIFGLLDNIQFPKKIWKRWLEN